MAKKSKMTEHEKHIQKRRVGSLLQLIKYILRYKLMIACVIISVLAANVLALIIPELTGVMVDSLNISTGTIDFNQLLINGLYIIAVTIAVWILSVIQNMLMLKTAQNVVLDLRHDVFAKLMKLPVSYFDNNTKGNIISIISVDIDNISDTVSSDAITLITGFVTVVGSLFMMLAISPVMALIFVVTVPAMFISARIISKKSRKLFRVKKNCFGELCGYAEEMITAQKTVKVYGIEKFNEDRFFEISSRLKTSGAKAEFVSSTMMPILNGINNLNFTLICAIGAFLVLSGRLSIGNISSFVLYSKKFAHPIVDTANIINMLQSSLAACDRVFSILNADAEPDVLIPETSSASKDSVNSLDRAKGKVEFEHVNFSYIEDKPVLKDVSFTINPGETVAIVGATGSGKTTIVSLLLRFYDINSGKIKIDGIDIDTLPLDQLRKQYAMVLQDSWLFEGTVMENITYAAPKERSDPDTVRRLCKQIEVDDFIESLSNGYDTVLHSDSGGLSQGQKQLINIARTFLCDPPIFILDEATSSVDTQTEAKIKLVTDNVTRGKTSIIIAHRLSTIINADKIMVMRHGEIIEVGSHSQLIEKGGLYKTLYESQFAELD